MATREAIASYHQLVVDVPVPKVPPKVEGCGAPLSLFSLQTIWYWALVLAVSDVIFAPSDTISVEKNTNVMWDAVRGAHKIPRKKKQSTKGSTSGLFHRRMYPEVAAAPE